MKSRSLHWTALLVASLTVAACLGSTGETGAGAAAATSTTGAGGDATTTTTTTATGTGGGATSTTTTGGGGSATSTTTGTGGAGGSGGSAGGGGEGGTPDLSGPTCAVRELLKAQCWTCHGVTPKDADNELSLVTVAQWKAPSDDDPLFTNAQRSVIRMQEAADPMPPGPVLHSSAADVALLQAWIDAGYPSEECGPAGEDPYDAPPQCTSGVFWNEGLPEDSLMNPGGPCNQCHQLEIDQGEHPPLFTFAGTVYPTAHEPDDCNAPPVVGAQVEVIDATGIVVVVDVGPTGNFEYSTPVPFTYPYTARVVYEGRERRMYVAADHGDCNLCHAQNGDVDTPGRILLP